VPARKDIVVFPTDFSKLSLEALPWVERMCKQLGAELHCLYVVLYPLVYETFELGQIPLPPVDDLVDSAKRHMETFAKDHLTKVGTVVTKVLSGRPAEAIVDYAGTTGATLIIITTHGYGGLKHAFLGSTTEAVLRHANCPVLSVRSKSPG
jgi:nucleotide-binding universal stress UspA family protein